MNSLDCLGPEFGLGLELWLGVWLGDGRRGEAGERRPEERRGSEGKQREEGEEEERIGSIC